MAYIDAKALYYAVLRVRMVEERIAQVYAEQEIRCPVHLCVGQEAVAVGVCSALKPRDYVLSNHRSHGHYLAKGGDLRAMMAELYGKVTGCSRGKGGSMHLVDPEAGFLGAAPIVGSTIPIAVGTAFGSVLRGSDAVTATFFGDGATEEGAFHESLDFAALRKLPVIFVCENNLYSVYSPLSVRQARTRDLLKIAEGHGIWSRRDDGNDVERVLMRATEAIERARSGGGPGLLEFMTYRWREHCGPAYDNQLGYRSEAEFESWKERCPIALLRQRLLEGGLATAEQLDEMAASISDEIDDALRYAKHSAFPDPSQTLDHVYAL